MKTEVFGVTVKIPKGYTLDSNGLFINGHGVEYAPAEYGRGKDSTIVLEPVYSKHGRIIELEKVN